MAKGQSIRTEAISTPVSIKEAIEFLGKIGILQRQTERINNALNNFVEKLKTRATEKIIPREQKIQQLFDGLFIFAQGRRDELTERGEKKTVQWPTGQIGWRLNPPSVKISNKEIALSTLKELGLEKFIRTVEEVDKETILKERESESLKDKKIKGITIEQKEIFVAKPSKLEIEISKTIQAPKKATGKG